MGFFDFLFDKTKKESSTLQTFSPVEQVVKESVEHLKNCMGTLTSEKLEAEAINLAAYIFLRKSGKIQFELDFLTKGIMDKIPSGDYAVADKVFPLMIKYGEGLYTSCHANFGKDKGYKLNVIMDPDFANFLKGYYKSVHKINVGEPTSQSVMSKTNSLQTDKVDLGLPSGVLWASCNIGASLPSEVGNYYAWGENESKDAYGWETYKLCRGSYNSIYKYTEVDGKSVLEAQDDVATVQLGSEWRLPTQEEMTELINSCKWTWESQNGQLGWLVTGKNGNSIFLPAAGAASSYRIAGVGELGRYWTATRDESNYSAYNLRFKDGRETIQVVDDTRFYGRSVRAVCGKRKSTQKNGGNCSAQNKIESKKYELNGLCELAIRQLMEAMTHSDIYANIDMFFIKLPNGGVKIRQEEYGNIYNDFDFLGVDGWIRYVRIYGKGLGDHYSIVKLSMEVFGMQVESISLKENYVECVIDQAQFGR